MRHKDGRLMGWTWRILGILILLSNLSVGMWVLFGHSGPVRFLSLISFFCVYTSIKSLIKDWNDVRN